LGEFVGFVAKIAAKIENVTTKLNAPKIRGFLRPTRSRMKMMKLRQIRKSRQWNIIENLQKSSDSPHGAIDANVVV
jgi:hypothetical protein